MSDTKTDLRFQAAKAAGLVVTDEMLDAEHRRNERPLLDRSYDPQFKASDSAAIVSGGLDSMTLVYDMIMRGHRPHLISFDYGQRHGKELYFARAAAKNLKLRHDIVNLTGITRLISNSALTAPKHIQFNEAGHEVEANEIEVPDGHYAEETMKATVVPNRNMIMLSIAAGVAVNNSYKQLGIGVHSGDHFIYPDCRPRFINATNAAIVLGNAGFGGIAEQPDNAWPDDFLYTPFLHWSKADIALHALKLSVPLHMTWSCYKGGDLHCGRCGTCVERLEAIAEAIYQYADLHDGDAKFDHTEYEDTEFWKQAVRSAGQVS